MRFFINPTNGDDVTGWLCQDDYRAETQIKVVFDGQTTTLMDCTVAYSVLKEWGWHRTGLGGFVINDETLPGFAAAGRVEVFDPGSNVLLYRHVRPKLHPDRKFLLVNTGAGPEAALQAALFERFQHVYFDIGNLPDEAIRTVMSNAKWMDSIFLSGHLLVPRYEELFSHSSIEAAVLIRDPHEVLAGRLHRLRGCADVLATPSQAWRVAHLKDAIAFAGAFDPRDRRTARRALRDLPEAAYKHLADPLTRQLGTKQPGDPCGPDNAAVAIEILSRADLVGHVAHFDAFLATVFDRLGITDPPSVSNDVPAAVTELAEALRGLGEADFLVENDLRLSEAVSSIIAKQWAA